MSRRSECAVAIRVPETVAPNSSRRPYTDGVTDEEEARSSSGDKG